MKKKIVYLSIFLLALCSFFFILPIVLDRSLNRVVHRLSPQPSPQAIALHQKLSIVDLHSDCLLWNRDLLANNTRGHVDVPRLIAGKVAVQAFTVVTQMPPAIDFDGNEGTPDLITPLVIAQRWPVATWRSLRERALFQATKLHHFAEQSSGKLLIIKSTKDLSAYLERRRDEKDLVAGFLGIEGAHALEGDLANLDLLFDAGFRMIAPTHFFDNEIGGSAHGTSKQGLTELGREMIQRMESKRMIVDLAHASPHVIEEVVGMTTRPVVISHTGVKGACNNDRNISDAVIRLIAGAGGVIAIGYWETATCGGDAKAVARAFRYAANVAGVEHLGLGSDFDGAVSQPFDTAGLVKVTDALLAEGFGETEIEKIMGGNVLRLLMENLPQ